MRIDHPPHRNLIAEHAVLGAVIVTEGAALEQAARILTPDDFFDYRNSRIYRHMLNLAHSGAPITPSTLYDAAQRDGGIQTIGGADYLASIGDGVPHRLDVEYHAKIVKEKTILRHAALHARLHPPAHRGLRQNPPPRLKRQGDSGSFGSGGMPPCSGKAADFRSYPYSCRVRCHFRVNVARPDDDSYRQVLDPERTLEFAGSILPSGSPSAGLTTAKGKEVSSGGGNVPLQSGSLDGAHSRHVLTIKGPVTPPKV
ncbi:MAG: hypothetical protein K6U09_01050 [Acidobacteriia bacterium]|jgi:hypothetical protein|nr:hypothetical protein [Terriglobia bacterium]